MTLAFAALIGGVVFFVTGVKGWSVQEFFSNERPTGSAGGFAGTQTSGAPAGPLGPTGLNPNVGGAITGSANAAVLISIGTIAESQFQLNVHECDAPGAPARWGPVHRVHVPGSYHYRHRAMDVSGSVTQMRAFANWVDQNQPGVTELFWNGPGCVNRKNGNRVNCGFVSDHTDHVHVAV